MSTNTTINSVPKNILVTGALGGIGRAICLQFAREGYCIIAHDISDVHNSNVKDFCKSWKMRGR